MKQNIFIILLMLLCCFARAQTTPDTLQTYSTEKAACFGFEKSPARFRDQSGQSRAVIVDKTGNVYYVAYTCLRGYYRQPMPAPAVVAAD